MLQTKEEERILDPKTPSRSIDHAFSASLDAALGQENLSPEEIVIRVRLERRETYAREFSGFILAD